MAGTARSYALNLLRRRLRSRAELEAALTRRQVPAEERDALLNELTEVGLLDDLRFATLFVQARDRLQPRGWPVLMQELRKKGIAEEVIVQVKEVRRQRMEDDPEDYPNEEAQARDVLSRHERRFANLDPAVRYRRAAALLARRGFAHDLVRRILKP